MDERIELIDPTAELEGDFRAMAAEYARAGEDYYQDVPTDFGTFVSKLADESAGKGLPAGWVPCNHYWLVRDGGRVLGTSRLRHKLTDSLLYGGGHIGYEIRPSERRKGYGTRLLALTLERARARGLQRVMLSCLVENQASAGVIEANGGVFEDAVDSSVMNGRIKRYWIDL